MKRLFSPSASGLLRLVLPLLVFGWSTSVAGRTLNRRLYVPLPSVLSDSVITVPLDTDSGVRSQQIDVRGAMAGIGERPGLASAYWGMELAGPSDTLRLTLRHGNTSFGDILDKRQNLLSLSRGKEKLVEKDVRHFESSSGTYNSLRLTIDRHAGSLSVAGGGKSVEDIFTVALDPAMLPDAVNVWSRGELTLASMSVETSLDPSGAFASGWTPGKLTEYLAASADPLEGYWRYLDRENNPQYARPGGRYLLAVVKSGSADGGYDIIYVDGAETFRDQWQPMMLKGRLRPTIFLDHYDLEWTDSTFDTIDRDIHATVTEKSILTLSFPLLKTTLRFSKMPLKTSYHEERQADKEYGKVD